MNWVHRHRRRGALLSLAALALQITLSFGHVHLNLHNSVGYSHGPIAAARYGHLAQTSPCLVNLRSEVVALSWSWS